MRGSPDQLRQLGPLIISGRLEDLQAHMISIWPPDSYMSDEDVGYVTMLLRGVRNLHGEKGRSVYMVFSEKLKAPGEREWLRTLALRAETVLAYDGFPKTLEWLESLREQTLPPDDGVVSLVIGKLYFSEGNYAVARDHLLRSVNQSLRGIEWFRLEALNEMALCLIKLNESRLAFEYVRVLLVESFKLGRTISGSKMGEFDLYRSIYNLALHFGQVEYAIDTRINLANRFQTKGHYSASSQFYSDAGFRFAELGIIADAIKYLRRAAKDAEMGPHPGDAPFAGILYLLAYYLDEHPIKSFHIEAALELSHHFVFPPMAEAILETREWLNNPTKSQTAIEESWLRVVASYDFVEKSGIRDGRVGKLLVGIHAAALVSRFLAEQGQSESSNLIEKAIATSLSRDAIFVLVREKYIEKLLRHSDFKQALEICDNMLLQRQLPMERFAIRNLAAKCHLAMGDNQKAYLFAKSALSDWQLVLEGLYTKQRKLSWLQRGVTCLSCALASIRAPVSWMTEGDRRKALFNLIELQKARLASDMMTQSGHVPGAYDLSKTMSSAGVNSEILLSRYSRYSDWKPVCLLQLSSLTTDSMTTVVHDDSGSHSFSKVDLAPLKSMMQLPIDPDKQLFATASSLCFEKDDDSYRDELYSDLIAILSPERQNDYEYK